jgi:hypothetical protein
MLPLEPHRFDGNIVACFMPVHQKNAETLATGGIAKRSGAAPALDKLRSVLTISMGGVLPWRLA